jgi:acyl dehydratase
MGLSFDVPPSVSLLTVARKRKGEPVLPRLEARAARLPFEAGAYARVCGFTSADPLPLTVPDVMCRGLQLAVLTQPRFPFPLLGAVHVRQRITRTRHLSAAEPLSGRVWVEGFSVVKRGAEFELHTEVSSGDALVWEGVTTILTRAAPGDGLTRPRADAPRFTPERSVLWRLDEGLGRRYAAVSGDWNPIHLSALSARVFGFPRAIVHGWWSLARCLAELDTRVPTACTVEAEFLKPVPLPSVVTFEAGQGRFELRRRDESCVRGHVR